jgi:hypothetical protein
VFDTYKQLGYVTNDLARAIGLVRDAHGLGPFKETRDLTIGARGDLTVTGHFAQAFRANLQFEIIETVNGDRDFYDEALLADAFAMRLHHIGSYYADPAAYMAAQAPLSRWAKVVDHRSFGGSYCYFDTREPLGHYLELATFPPADHFEGVPCY